MVKTAKSTFISLLILLFLSLSIFYSCSLLGIVSKTDRVNMFIDALNSSNGDESSINNILSNFSTALQIYDQIKTPAWWESSVFASTDQPFNINNLTEQTDGTLTATITSGGGLNDTIIFTMTEDPNGIMSWLISKIDIGSQQIIY